MNEQLHGRMNTCSVSDLISQRSFVPVLARVIPPEVQIKHEAVCNRLVMHFSERSTPKEQPCQIENASRGVSEIFPSVYLLRF